MKPSRIELASCSLIWWVTPSSKTIIPSFTVIASRCVSRISVQCSTISSSCDDSWLVDWRASAIQNRILDCRTNRLRQIIEICNRVDSDCRGCSHQSVRSFRGPCCVGMYELCQGGRGLSSDHTGSRGLSYADKHLSFGIPNLENSFIEWTFLRKSLTKAEWDRRMICKIPIGNNITSLVLFFPVILQKPYPVFLRQKEKVTIRTWSPTAFIIGNLKGEKPSFQFLFSFF